MKKLANLERTRINNSIGIGVHSCPGGKEEVGKARKAKIPITGSLPQSLDARSISFYKYIEINI